MLPPQSLGRPFFEPRDVLQEVFFLRSGFGGVSLLAGAVDEALNPRSVVEGIAGQELTPVEENLHVGTLRHCGRGRQIVSVVLEFPSNWALVALVLLPEKFAEPLGCSPPCTRKASCFGIAGLGRAELLPNKLGPLVSGEVGGVDRRRAGGLHYAGKFLGCCLIEGRELLVEVEFAEVAESHAWLRFGWRAKGKLGIDGRGRFELLNHRGSGFSSE